MGFAAVRTNAVGVKDTPGTSYVYPVTATIINNLLVVHIDAAFGSVDVTSVTDNQGNAYVLSSKVVGPDGQRAYMAYGVQVTGGATSVTINLSGSNDGYVIVAADEFSGGKTTNALIFDQTSSNVSGGSTNNVTSFALSAGELVIGSVTSFSGGPFAAGTGYTRYVNDDSWGIYSQYKLSSGTLESSPCTPSGASTLIVAAFKPLQSTAVFTKNIITKQAVRRASSW